MGAKSVKGEVLSKTEERPVHSKIGASSMHRWAACPGSVNLCADIPNRSSSYAEEGTEAHEWAAKLLKAEALSVDIPDPEMAEHVVSYVDYVFDLAHRRPGCKLLVEHGFDLSELHEGMYGTADAVIYDAFSKTLHVIDLKYGAGISVEVEENEQLMYYGVGALLSLNLPCDKVVLHIVQPRCGGNKVWETSPMRLLDFTSDLIAAAKKTEDPSAPLSPGDHCRFCPAAAICPSIYEKAQALALQEFSNVEVLPPEGSNDFERLGNVLQWLPVLEGWIKGVRDFAYSEAERGRHIPGWKLVAKRASRKWTDEVKIGQFLESEFPMTLKDFYERSLKSPAQIEQVLHKKQHDKLVPFISSVSSGNKLVPKSDAGEEIVVLTAEQEFSKVSDQSEAVEVDIFN